MTQEQTDKIRAAEKVLEDAKRTGNQPAIDAAAADLARLKKEAS